MAFNSLHFLLFFPVVLLLYHGLPDRFRWQMLLLASLYFYGVWKPIYLLLLLFAIVVAYYGGILVEDTADPKAKRRYLGLSMTLLLGTLFVYKYFNFFNDSARALAQALGMPYALGALELILPLGISFYTFQKIAYLIDIHRGKIKAERHFGIFALFASFWPQLVAGPIERAANLLPQFREKHRYDYDDMSSGLRLMAWGLFKKTVVADRLAPFVNDVYAAPGQVGAPALIMATVFFAFQVYCDFSAYSDIAIGAARTMGFRLMTNFNQPYFAVSISDFWKRWHISLSTWLTDYVYTPLTRARWLKLKWYPKFLLSLLLTFLVSGLWHGANWTFVAWGALHGIFLITSMLTQKLRAKTVTAFGLNKVPRLHTVLRVAFTFSLVCISYVFFRAATIHDAVSILLRGAAGLPAFVGDLLLLRGSGIGEFTRGSNVAFALASLGIAIVVAVDYFQLRPVPALKNWWGMGWFRWGTYFAISASVTILGAFYGDAQGFVYFQF